MEVLMERPVLTLLLDQIAQDGAVNAQEALDIRRAVFPDGVVDRAEAEALVRLAGKVATGTDDRQDAAAFAATLAEALSDHVLGGDGHVTDADATWLAAATKSLAPMLGLEVLACTLRRAESAPESLASAARASVLAACAGRAISARDVGHVRTILFAAAGESAVHVGLEEARWVLALDANCDGFAHDPDWADLFMKAMLNHVLGQRASPLLAREGILDRRAWLSQTESGGALAFLSRAFSGGLRGYVQALKTPDTVTEMERHYESRLAHAAQDERLTLQEVAHLVALVRADGKRTANEARLIEAVRAMETVAA
jgi:hypothetical protein